MHIYTHTHTPIYTYTGNGCWDLIDAQTILKYETAVAKKRAITMLPPKIQEKKDTRVLEKLAAKI